MVSKKTLESINHALEEEHKGKRKPSSDQKLADIVEDEGDEKVSRRTVAKIREKSDVPNAQEREIYYKLGLKEPYHIGEDEEPEDTEDKAVEISRETRKRAA